jgi:hypothetical protein
LSEDSDQDSEIGTGNDAITIEIGHGITRTEYAN